MSVVSEKQSRQCTRSYQLRSEFDPNDRQGLYVKGYGGRPPIQVDLPWAPRLPPTSLAILGNKIY